MGYRFLDYRHPSGEPIFACTRKGAAVSRKYVFADESGNFDFRDHSRFNGASRYFAVGTLLIEGDKAVAELSADMLALRREFAWKGVATDDAFHASEDSQAVRNAVFQRLGQHDFRIDVTLLEKAKAQPQTRTSDPQFFKYAWYYHFKMVAQRALVAGDELMVVAASIGTKKLRTAFRTAVSDVVRQCCDWRVPHRVSFWPTQSDPCLQAADYGLWAVMRQQEGGDSRALMQIKTKVQSTYDLWKPGATYYYGPLAAKRHLPDIAKPRPASSHELQSPGALVAEPRSLRPM